MISPRQHEYLTHFVCGLREKEIARRMGISPKTVGSHKLGVYKHAGVSSDVHLTLWCITNGYLKVFFSARSDEWKLPDIAI